MGGRSVACSGWANTHARCCKLSCTRLHIIFIKARGGLLCSTLKPAVHRGLWRHAGQVLRWRSQEAGGRDVKQYRSAASRLTQLPAIFSTDIRCTTLQHREDGGCLTEALLHLWTIAAAM